MPKLLPLVVALSIATPVLAGRSGIDLEPCRVGSTALAKPRGWTCRERPDGKIVMHPPRGGVEALLLIEDFRKDKPDDAQEIIAGLIARYPGARVLRQDRSGGWEHATAALAFAHKGHTGRVALDVRQWHVGAGAVLRKAMMIFAKPQEFERAGGSELLASVATSLGEGGEVTPAALEGVWESVEGRRLYDLHSGGNWAGTSGRGTYVRLELLRGRYRFFHLFTTDGPALAGWSSTEHSGTFETDGSTITLRYSACKEKARIDGRSIPDKPCRGEPHVTRVSRSPRTEQLSLAAIGLRDRWDTSVSSMSFARAKAQTGR